VFKLLFIGIVSMQMAFAFKTIEMDLDIISQSKYQFHNFISKEKLEKLKRVINSDILERKKTKGLVPTNLDLFQPDWITQGEFKPVALRFRPDKKLCGEYRIVYRLTYNDNQYLPMTAMLVSPINDCTERINDINNIFQKFSPETLEINLLALRVAAPLKSDTAGYSEYILRVFNTESMLPVKLDNTPNINLNDNKKNKLKKWIKKNSDLIKTGYFDIPEEFLSTRAISFGPGGKYRKANKVFEKLFGNKNKILNNNTCQGCHQQNSISGFHILGNTNKEDKLYNQLYDSTSPHLKEQIQFEQRYLAELSKGKRLSRPIVLGHHKVNSSDLGKECSIQGEWKNHDIAYYDSITITHNSSCSSQTMCMTQEIGFPNGYCIGFCNGDEDNCHPVPSLMAFSDCLEKKNDRDFCFKNATSDVLLKKCSESSDCRDDYVCASNKKGNGGVCVPPYFLFQLNLNGHLVSPK